MGALGVATAHEGVCYLVGGATSVLMGWRATTVDVDLRLEPELDEVLRALPAIKNTLAINVELASPHDFIPLPEGWRERSPSVARHGLMSFRHFDLYSQALAKLERGHARDLEDVEAMLERRLIDRTRLREFFADIEPDLYRFPAIDPADFERSVAAVAGGG